ncbi:PLP-dependent transferase [Mycoavidus sp. SF9855]|nr:PLP-dependent transferase [Mycoavidus sp. SF9855]
MEMKHSGVQLLATWVIRARATTTHSRISPQARAAAGITEGLIRLVVGRPVKAC